MPTVHPVSEVVQFCGLNTTRMQDELASDARAAMCILEEVVSRPRHRAAPYPPVDGPLGTIRQASQMLGTEFAITTDPDQKTDRDWGEGAGSSS